LQPDLAKDFGDLLAFAPRTAIANGAASFVGFDSDLYRFLVRALSRLDDLLDNGIDGSVIVVIKDDTITIAAISRAIDFGNDQDVAVGFGGSIKAGEDGGFHKKSILALN
jgi:hypothetical protein